ncbi:MAG: tetratricopeptide repeat protein [Sandaracinaceae bacterium]
MPAPRPTLEPSTADELLRACDALEAGRADEARSLASRLAASSDAYGRTIGARLFFLMREYPRALAVLRAGDSAEERGLRFAFLKMLRFEHEAAEALESLLVHPTRRTHEAAALHFQGLGEPARALVHMHAILRDDDGAHWHRLQALLAEEACDREVARAAITASHARDPAGWREDAELALRCGAYPELEALAAAHEEDALATAYVGALRLYAGELEEALSLGDRAWAASPSPMAHEVALGARVAAGVEVPAALLGWGGGWTQAARAWNAEYALRSGRREEARATLRALNDEVPDYLAAKLLWARLSLDEARGVDSSSYEGVFEGQIQSLGIEVPSELREPQVAVQIVEAGLAALAGNRSPWPSRVRDGRLVAVAVPASIRHVARRMQHRARWQGIEATRVELDRLLAGERASVGGAPVAECYRAELDLWAGDYAAAGEALTAILARAPRTVWAYVGLAQAQTLGGDPERALATLDRGVEVIGWRGPLVACARAEALMRVGRLAEARAENREAVRLHPSRLSARVIDAMLAPAGDMTAWGWLVDHAPALLADAAQACGVEGWYDAEPTVELTRRLLEECLTRMRGNRSSSCAMWWSAQGHPRAFVMDRPPSTPAYQAAELTALRRVARRRRR